MMSWGRTIIVLVFAALMASCGHLGLDRAMSTKANPAVYFEIPVTDMSRAQRFYSAVFGYDFFEGNIHGNDMAFLPFFEDKAGITGTLAKGPSYVPSKDGSLIYLRVENIESTIALAINHGGKVLFPRTKAGDFGFVAEIEDSEGNRIGLSDAVP